MSPGLPKGTKLQIGTLAKSLTVVEGKLSMSVTCIRGTAFVGAAGWKVRI